RNRQEAAEIVGARKLLEDAAALIKAHPANHGAQVSFATGNPDPMLKVNPAEILQVLINLGVNALHATNGTGTLQFSALRATTLPTEFAFRADNFDAQTPLVKMTVVDNG